MADRKNKAAAKSSNTEPEKPSIPTQSDAGAAGPQKPPTIRSICEEGLLANLPYAEIIANVKKVHPAASTTPGCIAWYRSKLAKKGMVPTGKELAEARKRAAEERAKAAGEGAK